MWLAAVHGADLLSHLLGGAEGPLYFAVHICLTVLHEDGTFGVTLGHFLLPLQRREAAVSGALLMSSRPAMHNWVAGEDALNGDSAPCNTVHAPG